MYTHIYSIPFARFAIRAPSPQYKITFLTWNMGVGYRSMRMAFRECCLEKNTTIPMYA